MQFVTMGGLAAGEVRVEMGPGADGVFFRFDPREAGIDQFRGGDLTPFDHPNQLGCAQIRQIHGAGS